MSYIHQQKIIKEVSEPDSIMLGIVFTLCKIIKFLNQILIPEVETVRSTYIYTVV